MEQLKKCSIPLYRCDLLLGNLKTKSKQISVPLRTSKRILLQRERKKEVKSESDSSLEAETSEVEKITPEDDEKSEYERMIQKNKERSLAFLQSLKLDEVKDDYCKAVQDLKLKIKPGTKKRAPDPSSSPPVLRKRVAIVKEVVQRSHQFRKLPISLKFEEAVKGKEVFFEFVHNSSELCYEKTKKLYNFIPHLKSMKLSQTAKVAHSSITALAIHPVRSNIIIAAADFHGRIGFWNVGHSEGVAERKDYFSRPVETTKASYHNSDSNPFLFVAHHGSVTNIVFNPYDAKEFVSSGFDGTLRCGDMEKHIFKEVYRASKRTWCTYFDVLSKTILIVGHRTGGVAVVDYRAKKSLIKEHSCHEYSVRSVSIHPVDKNYFITSEVEGTIKLWDLRKLQLQPVIDVQHHKKSVSSAFFSPLTGSSILSTSLDKSLGIFDSSNLSVDIPLKKRIKHENNFYSATAFKAVWAPNTDDTFVVGSMLYPRRIEVYNKDGNNIFNFISKDLKTSTSLHAFHPSLPVLAGGNSSGKIFVFTDTI